MNNGKNNLLFFLNKYKYFIIVSLLIILFLTIIFFSNPEKKSFFLMCWFYRLTGYYCPFCGSTRAIYHFLHFNILKSIRSNLLLYIITMYLLIKFLINKNSTKKNKFFDIKPLTIIIFMLIIISYWILRNLPYYPFNLFIPD